MKPTLLLLYALLLVTLSNAQQSNPIPIAARDVFFLYQEFGLPNSTEPKVLVISECLYRYKFAYGYDQPALVDGVRAPLMSAFGEKMKEIVKNEHHTNSDNPHNQVITKSNVTLEFAYLDNGVAEATGPELYLTLSSATDLLVRVRERIIADYREMGYKVFQTGFSAYIDDHLKQMQLEHIERLSPLYVEPYRHGDILRLARPYLTSSNSAGITVEPKKANNGSTANRDDTDWAAVTAAKRQQAEAYEAEGDRLNALGTLYMGSALEQYRLAQETYYTDRVQEKINTIDAYYKLGQSLNYGMEKLDGFVDDVNSELDASGVPHFAGLGIAYSGLVPQFGSKNAHLNQVAPFNLSMSYSTYRILAMELGVSYSQSPTYEFFADRNGIDEPVHVSYKSAGFMANIGAGYTHRNFAYYVVYGWNIDLLITEANTLTEGYIVDKGEFNIGTGPTKIKAGVNFRVPKTRLGLGLHYSIWFKKGYNLFFESADTANATYGDQKWDLNKSRIDPYMFHTLGASIYLLRKN